MRCFAKYLLASSCVFFASLLGVFTASAADTGRHASPASEPIAAVRYGDLPLHFEANQGQSDPQVRFLSRGSGYSFFLTQTGAVMTFARDSHTGAAVLEMQLAGAAPNAIVRGLDPLPGKSNYFAGSDSSLWRTGVPTYSKIEYDNVYPGINLVYYGNQRQLEYDFVVAPGADPQHIRLAVSGAQTLTLDAQGNLLLHSDAGDVQLLAPKVYQRIRGRERSISGQWTLAANNVAGFRLGIYDHKHPLIIDPVLTYSSFLGGSQKSMLSKVAVDAAGNAYVAGYTSSGDFPAAPTPQAVSFGAGAPARGAFVAKIDPTGSTLLYATYLSGSVDEEATGLAVDKSGNVYIAGTTHSADFPTRNALQSTCATHTQAATCSSAFLAKISPTGDQLLYATYLGGSGTESARSLAVDASGSAYIAGTTSSLDFPVTLGAAQTKCAGACQQSGFVAKLNPAGTALAYATYVGGSGSDDAADIAVDSTGNAYLTGHTTSPDFPLATPYQKSCTADTTSSSAACVATSFITKISPDGSAFAYSTYLGGTLGSAASAIAVDSLGSAYVTGSTQSPDFPLLKPYQKSCGIDAVSGHCSVDAFLTKFSPSGKTLVYSTYLGGSGHDEALAIALDPAGNAHIAGRTESANLPVIASAQKQLKGSSDAFVARFNPEGTAITFSTYHGGSATESANGLALDAKGNVYLTGTTTSTDFPTSHPFQSSCAGPCASAFVTKMALPPPAVAAPTIAKAFSPTSVKLNVSASTSTLTLTIANPATNAVALTGVAVSDTLPSGMAFATPDNLATTCGGTATAAAGVLSLTGGTIAINSSCTVTVDVKGTTAGDIVNTTGAVSSTNGGTGLTDSATLTVIAPPTIAKNFAPGSVPLNGTSTLTLTITNPAANTVALAGVAVSDTLPAGMAFSTPNNLANTCGGTATAAAGVLSLTAGTIATGSNCKVSVDVDGTTAGSITNTTGTVSSTNGGTGLTAFDALTVVTAPTIAKAFAPATVALNGTSTLSLTITNPAANTVALAGVAVSDTLPAGMVFATPNNLANTCGGTPTAAAGVLSLTAGTVAVNSNCTVSVSVKGTTSGTHVNTTGTVSSTNGGTGPTANSSLTVGTPPTIAKSFAPATVQLNGTSTITLTITNPAANAFALTGVAVSDTLPAGMAFATPNNLANTCGGTATAAAGVLSLTAGTIAINSNCKITVDVDGTAAGDIVNTTGTVSSTNGGTGLTATDTLTVIGPPTIAKAFAPASVQLNVPASTSTLTLTITNPAANTVAAAGVAVSDTLPAGMAFATPNNLANTCGGTPTAAGGVLSLTGGAIAINSNCKVSVDVVGTTAGNITNTTGTVSSTNGGTGLTAAGHLIVVAPPALAEVFNPVAIPLGSTSSLNFTISNPAANTVAETGVSFTDVLPAGLTATAVASNTCGGSPTASGTTISLSGATVPVGNPGTCVLSITVTGNAAGNYSNIVDGTSGTVLIASSNGGIGVAGNTATLRVVAPPTIAKAFSPTTITLNATTTLTFTLGNPAVNAVPLMAVAFTDNFTALNGNGLVATATVSNTCGGTLNASGSAVSLSGATIPAGTGGNPGTCSVSVTVKGTARGLTSPNTTGTVTSTNGGAGTTSNTATLTVQDYDFAATPNSTVFTQGATVPAAATVTITPQDTYGGTVSSAAPGGCSLSGFTCSFANTKTGDTPVTISNAPSTSVGFYSIVISGADDSTPQIVHSALAFSAAVQCALSLNQVVPTFTPTSTPTPINQYSIGVSVSQGGTVCPYGNAGVVGVNNQPGSVTGDQATVTTIVTAPSGVASSAVNGSGTVTFQTCSLTANPANPNPACPTTLPATGYVRTPYFDATQPNNENLLAQLPVTVEAPIPATASTVTAGVKQTPPITVTATQLGTLTIVPVGTSSNVCGVVDSNGNPDSTGNNFGVSCSVTGVNQITVTVQASTSAASLRNERIGLAASLLLSFPAAIVFLGAGLSAFGPRRSKPVLKRLTCLLGILLVIFLLAILPSCGGGFVANFGTKGTGNFNTLTVMGYVSGVNPVQGVEIFTIPLTIGQ